MTAIYSETPNALVSAAYFETLAEFVCSRVPDIRAAPEVLKADRPVKGTVSVADYLAVVRFANSLLKPGWGVDLGRQFRPATYGILGLLPLHCENLLEALGMVLRFESLVHDLGVSETTLGGDQVVFRWHPLFSDQDCIQSVSESVVAGMQQFSSWLLGRMIKVDYLSLPGACDHRWLGSIGIQPVVMAGTLEMHIPVAELNQPIAQADQELKGALLTSAELMLKKRKPEWIKTLLEWFDRQLPLGECSLEQAADLLDLSPRSLQRRLSKQGLSYQQLLSNFRHDKAVRLLGHSDLSVLDIASRLGFHEQSSFSSAFRNWQGCSPTDYLRRHRN